MKKERLSALIAMLLAVILVFSGCNGAEQNATNNPQTESTDEQGSSGAPLVINGNFGFVDRNFVNGPEGNIYLNGKKVAQLEYDDVYISTGLNGKTALAHCTNEGDSGYTLFVVTEKGAAEIASEVYVTTWSDNIDYVVYRDITDNGENQTYTWYNVAKKKAETIGEDLSCVTLSPDGKTVAYAEAEEKDDGMEYTPFVKEFGGEVTAIGLEDATPEAVSNGAKYLYLDKETDTGSDLYRCVDKKEPEMVCGNSYLWFANVDHTEIVCCDEEKDIYYWIDGKNDPVTMATEVIDIVAPDGANSIVTFQDVVYSYGDNNIGYFDGKEMTKIASGVASVALAKDGKMLYFTKIDEDLNGELYYVNDTTAKKYEPIKVMEDVTWDVTISPDGKKVYVLTTDNELIECSEGKKGNKIADDVARVYAVNEKGICYFKDEDGILYASKNGNEKVKLADDMSAEGSGVKGLYGNYFYYEVDNTLYYATGTAGIQAE